MQDPVTGRDKEVLPYAKGKVYRPPPPLVSKGRRVVETYHYRGAPDWKRMVQVVDIITRNKKKEGFAFQCFTDAGVKTAFLLAKEGNALWGALYQPFFDVYLRKLLMQKVYVPAIPRRVKQRRAAIMAEVHREMEREDGDDYLFMRPRQPEDRHRDKTEATDDAENHSKGKRQQWTQRNHRQLLH